MQHHIQSIVNQIFKKDSLQEVTIQELQQFTDDYPYAAIGQLLFAKKLQETKAQNSSDQSAKTTLYFRDSVWLQWLLTEQQESIEESIARARLARENRLMGDTLTAAKPVPAVSAGIIPVIHENKPVADTASNESSTPVTTTEESAPPADIVLTGATTEIPEINAETESAPGPAEQEDKATGVPGETNVAETVSPEATTPVQTGTPVSDIPAGDDNQEAIFEPYHTIDYFASQGIKLRLEDLTSDKLGKQLKSFTEWLRSMKRIAPTVDDNTLDELARQSIQRIADHSNEAKDILTETMAEVWAKQGHPLKAIAIYEKLSLLNPAKSAYFVSRIEELKAQ